MRVRSYVLTDGVRDYEYNPEFGMTVAQADKMIELLETWKTTQHD